MLREIEFSNLSRYNEEARGYIHHIYLHWTAGRYGQKFGSYHLNIDHDGTIYSDMDDFMERKSHTWRRNSGAVGIALCCAYGAEVDRYGNVNIGDYPPTEAQLDMTGKVVAKMCIEIGIPLENVYTHAEIADIDGYGLYSGDCDMRWDLLNYGEYIRSIARGYMHDWGY